MLKSSFDAPRNEFASLLRGVLFVLLLLSASRAVGSSTLIATVIAERGHVQVERVGTAQDLALSTGQNLYVGDTVKTSSNGELDILFIDGSQVKLAANSSIRISDNAVAQRSQNLFQALVGVIWAHLRPGQTVATPAANVVVRGTEIALNIGSDGTTQVVVVGGEVTFANSKGSVELTDDQQSTAAPGSAPTSPVIVDPSGLISWTSDVVSLPLLFENPAISDGDKLRSEGDATGAADVYTAVLAADPRNINAAEGLALTRLSQGAPDSAKDAIASIQGTSAYYSTLGIVDLEGGSFGSAESDLLRALALNPYSYSTSSLLALTYLADAKLVDAESAARRGAVLNPSSADAVATLSIVLFFESKTREAKADAFVADRLNSHSPLALIALGRCLVDTGHDEEACTDYETAVAFVPRLWVVHQELGDVYLMLDNPRKAAEEFRIAAGLNVNDAEVHVGLARSFASEASYQSANSEFQQAIELAPDDPSARYYYATFLLDRGRLTDAVSQLNAVADKASTFGLLYARLAEVCLYRQDLFEAQKYALLAVKILPQAGLSHYVLGRVYYEEQHTYQAEQQFRLATVLSPRLATARYALGLVQEKTGSGLIESLPNIFDSPAVGSPASSTSLTDIDTPGANERIQAAVADPTAVRSATRSYGNTELDGITETNGSYDLAGSYLTEDNNGKGVAGISGSSQFQSGVRANADNTQNDASFVVGQKAQDKPIGYLVLGNYEQTNQGADVLLNSTPSMANLRYETQVNRLTAGTNVRTPNGGSIRAVLQTSDELYGGRSSLAPTDPNYYAVHLDIDSLDGELRWDIDPEEANSITAGLSYGNAHRLAYSAIGPEPLSLLQVWAQFKPLQAYVRDDYNAGGKFTFVAEMQMVQEAPTVTDNLVGYPSPTTKSLAKTLGLPYGIVSYKPDNLTLLRIRYRRIQAAAAEFQLLNPTDDFLLTYADLPVADSVSSFGISDGQSVEFEVDKTLANGSFASVGLYRQDLTQASNYQDSYGDAASSVRVQGAQASYQAILGRNLSFFAQGEYTDAEERQVPQRVPEVPKYIGLATLQYQQPSGFYGQAAYYYQGDELTSDAIRSNKGAFGLLNLRIGKRYGLRTNMFGEVNNVLNKKYDELGIVQPGIEARLGISQRY